MRHNLIYAQLSGDEGIKAFFIPQSPNPRTSCAKLYGMDEKNPVVLLSGGVWHIVEHSRQAKAALCGKPISDRQAHARYKQVGAANICPKCIKLFEGK